MGELRSRATHLCELAGVQTDRIVPPGTPGATITYLRRGAAILTPELKQLRTLQPPTEVADVYSTAMIAFSQKLGALTDAVHRLGRGTDPVAGLQVLQRRLGPLESEENGAWQALQIPACENR